MGGELTLGIISTVLLVLSGVFAAKWAKAKKVLKELAEAITATSDVLEDNILTDEEKGKAIKEWKDVYTSAKALLGSFKK